MADRPAATPDQILEVLRFAIAAAGDATDLGAWRGRMAVAIPEIAATLSPGSREYRQVEDMLNAVVITAEYLGFEYNDRSHRCKILLAADRGRKDTEHVWTERTDTKLGAAQLAILRSLPKGCHVIVWKGVETMTHDDERKVRMCYHIMRTDADVVTEREAGAPAAGPSPSPAVTPPAGDAPSPVDRRGSVSGDDSPEASTTSGESRLPVLDVAGALERLTNAQRVQVAKHFPGVNLYGQLDNDQANAVTAYIELLIGGMV